MITSSWAFNNLWILGKNVLLLKYKFLRFTFVSGRILMVDFFETVLHSTTSTYIIRLDFAQNTANFMCSALLHLSLEIETKRVLGENLLYYFYCSTPLYEILMMLSRFEAPLVVYTKSLNLEQRPQKQQQLLWLPAKIASSSNICIETCLSISASKQRWEISTKVPFTSKSTVML